ncbi:MAG: transglutaminase family protein [Eubacteriales bacterium]|nr:transglutaminase family protein [Eubacteriales bacterium]
MRKLQFKHTKQLMFDYPVTAHSFCLRLIPNGDSRQIICDVSYQVEPAEHLTEVTDEWGVTMCIGDCYADHTEFSYTVSGIAWLSESPMINEPLHPVYRYPSELTQPGPVLRARYAADPAAADALPLARAQHWMDVIQTHFRYESGATNVTTTAEQALIGGAGVCQDYAHILIALCRLDGIPARYTVGYLIGEGETHAWVEIFDGKGWYGMDPTHNRMINSDYIKVTAGRDYADCILDKGYFRPSGKGFRSITQTQSVHVSVHEAPSMTDNK